MKQQKTIYVGRWWVHTDNTQYIPIVYLSMWIKYTKLPHPLSITLVEYNIEK